MPIFAYLRVSTDRQDLENQRFAVGEYCTAKKLALGEVVTDTRGSRHKHAEFLESFRMNAPAASSGVSTP